jgi:hypothetical protein
VHADGDQRIVDRCELLDRVMRLREKAIDAIAVAAELAQRALELLRRLLDVGQRHLVRLRALIARPEQRDLLLHG